MISRSRCRPYLLVLPFLFAGVLQAQSPATAKADSLRNAGKFKAAVKVLEEHVRNYPEDYSARAMLGETLYWLGDYSAAAKSFRAVLRIDSTNTIARRELNEIKAATTGWASAEARRINDSQPITRTQLDVRAGEYITPLWSAGVIVQPSRAAAAGDTTLDRVDARAAIHGYHPGARMDLDFDVGLIAARSALPATSTSGTNAVGRARAGVHIAKGTVWSVSLERSQYTATLASLAAPLMTTAARTMLQVDRAGWLGEVAVQEESYPDDNVINTAYAWILAPLVKTSNALVQIGYAASYQDSDSSHYTLAGRYDPYFTPQSDRQHGVAASVMSWNAHGSRVQVNGSYGVYAHRETPTFTYHPYDIRGAVSLPFSARNTFTVSGERMRTAFYTQTVVTALVAIRFAARSAT